MQSPSPQNNQPRRRSGSGSFIALIILVVLSAALWLNRQNILDFVSYQTFRPSSAIASIESQDNLTGSGKFIFYASQPSVDEKTNFNQVCERKESGTAILGCYVNDRIYLYDVTDARLNGIEEVTAAHEMLHAVYQRMSPTDKASVDKLVEAEYQKLKDNPDYADRMAFYARTEPGQRDNELHSIIGTEVADISPQLEAHYAKYFTHRSAIVGYFNAYNSAFTSLANEAKTLATELDTINSQIKTASAQYNADVKSLNADIGAFNQDASNGTISSQAVFDTQRQSLVARSNGVEAERERINSLIDRYNSLRDQYNGIVTQSNNLYDSIDSSLAPAPKV